MNTATVDLLSKFRLNLGDFNDPMCIHIGKDRIYLLTVLKDLFVFDMEGNLKERTRLRLLSSYELLAEVDDRIYIRE